MNIDEIEDTQLLRREVRRWQLVALLNAIAAFCFALKAVLEALL